MAANPTPSSDAPIPDWPLVPSGYTLGRMLGQGGTAKVYEAHCSPRRCAVAVKIIPLDCMHASLADAQGEVRAMRLARHANVLELHAAFVVGATLWMVMPLLEKGSVSYVMRALKARGISRTGEGLPEPCMRIVLKNVLQGLAYLHANGQLHRDIKASNILVDQAGGIKVADFGVAAWLDEYSAGRVEGKASSFVGTLCWMAPEIMQGTAAYTAAVDIWSFGIMALELAKGVAPYSHLSAMQTLLKTTREAAPTLRSYTHQPGMARPVFGEAFHAMVAKCLQKCPSQRPTAAALLKHAFFKGSAAADRDALCAVLHHVPAIGQHPEREESAAAVSALQRESAQLTTVPCAEEYAPGTTWRFPGDGAPPAISVPQTPSQASETISPADIANAMAELAAMGATVREVLSPVDEDV